MAASLKESKIYNHYFGLKTAPENCPTYSEGDKVNLYHGEVFCRFKESEEEVCWKKLGDRGALAMHVKKHGVEVINAGKGGSPSIQKCSEAKKFYSKHFFASAPIQTGFATPSEPDTNSFFSRSEPVDNIPTPSRSNSVGSRGSKGKDTNRVVNKSKTGFEGVQNNKRTGLEPLNIVCPLYKVGANKGKPNLRALTAMMKKASFNPLPCNNCKVNGDGKTCGHDYCEYDEYLEFPELELELELEEE